MSYEVRKSFLAYKAAYSQPWMQRVPYRMHNHRVLVTLRITKGALLNEKPSKEKRRKLRANRARVVSIRSITANNDPGKSKLDTAYAGWHYHPGSDDFVYKVGAIVKPTSKFDHSYRMCSSGIHFFRSKQRALDYYP